MYIDIYRLYNVGLLQLHIPFIITRKVWGSLKLTLLDSDLSTLGKPQMAISWQSCSLLWAR